MTSIMAAPLELGPRGHYLAHEVGALAGVTGYVVGQWSRRGYIRASQSMGNPHVYAYQDIAESMVVHHLIEHGVALRYIKRALARLREEVGTEWPLQATRLLVPQLTEGQLRQTFGRGRTVAMERDGEIIDLIENHLVLPKSDLVAIADDLSRGGWAARDLPDLRFIEVDPDRLSGRPTIRGRRVAAELVAETAAESDGIETLRDGYGLTDEEIREIRQHYCL